MKRIAVALFFLSLFPFPLHAREPYVHHDLTVTLHPAEHGFSASDRVTMSQDSPREIEFSLHAGLSPSSPTPGADLRKTGGSEGSVPLESFRVRLPENLRTFTIEYRGAVYHPLEQSGREQARGFDSTPGVIADEGVFLSGSSGWHPLIESGLMTFNLEVQLPSGWDAVSQGGRTIHEMTKDGTRVRWESPEPQDEIYLVAARFTEYDKPAGNVLAMAFLRTPDAALANKYLDAAAVSLSMYGRLIGPYPYAKFAMVENFWETGFGMPSFTLLGPTIIRLPFIINTSYPHEILHNWWGNSVFPVYEKGNWSEGLTAYLADHLMKEQQSGGAEYRVNTLQKYADYVLAGRDFALTGFTSRHNPATEAIGYGKALMFFHMLRLELGDTMFIAGLREFYRANKFRFATFDDVRESFEKVSRKNLMPEFDQWVTRTGAPELKLGDAAVGKKGNEFFLSAKIRQVQKGEAYRLRIPLAVTLEGREQAYQTVVEMAGRNQEITLPLPARPLRLDVDPEFDVFRRLSRDEIPPAVTGALGAKKMLVILPASEEKTLFNAYEGLAKSIAGSGPDEVEIKSDGEVSHLPSDRAGAVLGWENKFVKLGIDALAGYDVVVSSKGLKIGKSEIRKKDHSFVFTVRNPENKDMALLMILSDRADALPGLGRKLPHYHKYSYLAFEGGEPANVAKGRWPVLDSPMTAFLPGKDGNVSRGEMGKLAPRMPLAELPPLFSKERMMETVKFLASDELKGRGLGTPELDRAAGYIVKKFQEAGLAPGGDKEASYIQKWEENGMNASLKNVIGVIPGTKKEFAGQSVVIGAHYDHLDRGSFGSLQENKGKIHPGADDNASGVAVLIELAKVLRESPAPDRSIVFIAFTGEEEGKIGSKHYAAHEKLYPVSKTIGMVNLDTVGRLGKKKLIVLGAGSASEWVHILRGAGFVTGVEIETVSEELDSSDQKSFQNAGAPAVQLFSGPHLDYHRPTDTADKIDPDGLVKAAAVTKEVAEYLAGREGPLTLTLKSGAGVEAGPKRARKVSLGTVPDYSFTGEGVKITGTVPGSPAESAGLREGDVIMRMNDTPIRGLRDLSDALKTMKAKDKITVTFAREGKEMKVEAVLKER